jgi:hypothetical protein
LDVAKELLPPGFDTRAKTGFSMPFNSWLKGPLREVMLDALSERSVAQRGLLEAPAVAHVRDQFLSGVLEWPQPWLLMMLELWAREVLDRPTDCLVRKLESEPMSFSSQRRKDAKKRIEVEGQVFFAPLRLCEEKSF